MEENKDNYDDGGGDDDDDDDDVFLTSVLGVSDHLHNLVVLSPGKYTPELFRQEGGWAPEAVGHLGVSKPNSLVVLLIACSLY